MTLKDQAETFLANKRIAVVGVSRSGGTGNSILHKLLDQGYEVFPVNPKAEELEGLAAYPSLAAIPGGVKAAIVVTKPEITEKVVRDCAEAGVSHVWMHYNALFGAGNSSVSEEAVAFCRDNGIDVIPGACPMMYIEGADFGHKCMRWILGVTNKLPETA
jgi:predicted CoA-binding protein